MKVISRICIRCNNCGNQYFFFPDELDYDNSFGNDGPMGLETIHYFSGEKRCTCGNDMYVEIIASEYPPGGYNNHTWESKNCKIINTPQVDVYYLPEKIVSAFEQIYRNPDDIYYMEPDEFEKIVAEIFNNQGCNTTVTKKTRDGGVDVKADFIMLGVPFSVYIQCKRYLPNNPVDVSIIRELSGVLERDRIDKGIIVTSSYFTKDSIREAKMFGGRIQLIDYRKLKEIMRENFDRED